MIPDKVLTATVAAVTVLAVMSGSTGAAPVATAVGAGTSSMQVEAEDTSEPQISVAVADRPVIDGGSITTGDDPELSIRAEAKNPIEVVSVRIDGETHRTFVPNVTTFEETMTLDIAAGERTLQVVVETSQSTTTYTATVTEDSVPPLMTFDSPFTTGGKNASIYESPNANYTLNTSRVRVMGTLHDHSSVEKAVIETRYRSQSDAEFGSRNRTVIKNPGSSISQVVRFGPSEHSLGTGENQLRVSLTDAFGQTRQYEVDIFINDTDQPTIEIVNQTAVRTQSAIKIRAHVTDRVSLRSVGFRIGPADGNGLKHTLSPKPPGNRPLKHNFTAVVPVDDGTGNITIVADDGTGNDTTRQVTVNRTELVTPRMQLSANVIGRPNSDSNQIRVSGRVYDGRIAGVAVESINPDGTVADLEQVYGGGVTTSVMVQRRLRVNNYPARVQLRVMDSTGREHTRTIQLSPNGSAGSTQRTPNESTGTETSTETTNPAYDTVDRTPLPGSPSSTSGLLGSFLELFSGSMRQLIGGLGGAVVGGYALHRFRR